jgi:hypothetical protein
VGEFSITGFEIGTSRATTLVPALTPRRLAGRSKVHATSKSTQFWQRPSASSLRLHLMLRLLQKSPKRQCSQFCRLTSGDPPNAKWSRVRRQAGEEASYRPWRRAGAFAVSATFIRDSCQCSSENWILTGATKVGCRVGEMGFWGLGSGGCVFSGSCWSARAVGHWKNGRMARSSKSLQSMLDHRIHRVMNVPANPKK